MEFSSCLEDLDQLRIDEEDDAQRRLLVQELIRRFVPMVTMDHNTGVDGITAQGGHADGD